MRRHAIRGFAFLAAAALALQFPPLREAAVGFAALSPLLNLLGALAVRSATPWTLLGLPVLILGFLHSRWFCRYACPAGLAAEGIGRLNPNARRRFAAWPPLGRWLLLLSLGGAAAGCPLFLWLDPLSLFNGFFAAWRLPPTASSFALAAGFPLLLLLSWIAPQAWCHRICPLGALQDALTFARRRRPPPPAPAAAEFSHPAFGRRTFLGVAAGGTAALALRRLLPGATPPLRPPGARPEDHFAGLCARCGACIRACPYQILRADFGEGGWTGLLAPVVDYSKAHCFEYCNECTKVCPTGAIGRLTLEAKRNLALGLAEVDRSRCIAWTDRQHCMVCQEFCPYLAIEAADHNGVPCPVVQPDQCRGCGACQVNCPARPDRAIVVRSAPQRPVRPPPGAAGPA